MRTTVNFNSNTVKKIRLLAKLDNRSIPNLIETIVVKYLENDLFADDFEMQEINQDKQLRSDILKGLKDYKEKKGKIY